jgi:hypothetical protein
MLNPRFHRYSTDPVTFAIHKLNLRPDPIQAEVLASTVQRGILCCTRQWGKSTIAAAKAVHAAIFQPNSTTLIAAPSERQSAELLRRCANFLALLNLPRRGDGRNRTSLLLPNGSRIIGLPHSEQTIRGFSAPALILIDEAAAVPDNLYNALVPMQATNAGSLWMMSTPRQKLGFFYEAWIGAPHNGFQPFTATAYDCPRISKSWLEQESRRLSKSVFEQEFLCVFRSSQSSLIDDADIEAALRPPAVPAPLTQLPPLRVYLGLDLGQRADHAALTVLHLHQLSTGRRDPVTLQHEILYRLDLQQVNQIPLGTPYPEIARLVRNTLNHPSLHGRSTLIIDAGGPGLAFADFLTTQPLRASLIKLNITGTGAPSHHQGLDYVSRSQLLTNLSLLFQNRLIHIPSHALLLNELRAIQSNFTTQADHDDLVMSLALAAWQANRNWQGALLDSNAA